MSEKNLFDAVHNPDVLSCLANLSNDEVFTPPEIANQMIDMLPQELFKDPKTKFLDPACKSGVFLREIAKRLIIGLEEKIPNLQERLDHIFHNQLFGIAITELTSLLSRRGLYCSKYPNGKYSVSKFDNAEGKIKFKKYKHTFKNDKCIHCGAHKSEYDRDESLEQHAYEFIHTIKPEEVFNMKFDVICSNPPYQLGIGNSGGNSSKAKAIYHNFISQAIKLNPHYICMIVPSRWMTRSTEGISDEWIDNMLKTNKIEIVHDFLNSEDCFPGVDIKGGVNYFLWNKNFNGNTKYYLHQDKKVDYREGKLDILSTGIVIRDMNAIPILAKIRKIENEYYNDDKNNFSCIVSPKDFYTNKEKLTSKWDGYSKVCNNRCNIKLYVNRNIHKIDFGWISLEDVPKNIDTVKFHKVIIPAAGGTGNDSQILGKPFYIEPGSVCSQTYLVIGYNSINGLTQENCHNIVSYINTKFFRYLVSIKKKTQNGPRGVYQFVPMQDFSKPWTDEELYLKYELSDEEIEFIETMIKPMENGEINE